VPGFEVDFDGSDQNNTVTLGLNVPTATLLRADEVIEADR
jgi:hypothetical protein